MKALNFSLVFGALMAALLLCVASIAQAQDATALRARHASLRESLANSPLQRPLVLESTQTSTDLTGDVFAVMEQPFAVVFAALQGLDQWCELLILHLNVKHCRRAGKAPDKVLSLVLGRKIDQPLGDGYRLDFSYSMNTTGVDYMKVQMTADAGPLGTRNYRLVFEATPLDAGRSFLHMSYSYTFGMTARLAMHGYLASVGRDKVGFSITGKGDDGKPVFIKGLRGVVERNTMRYYLAIEAYLGSLSAPIADQTEKRFRDWYAAVERYPLQLHELELNEYLEMKRREWKRQRIALSGQDEG